MYDLVIVWTLAFAVGPYYAGGNHTNQGAVTVDRATKSSFAACQADLTKAKKMNGQIYRPPQSAGSLLATNPKLFVDAYCTPH